MKQEFFSTSEARKVLSDLVNQVKYSGKEFTIGRHGKAEARLVPIESVGEVERADPRSDRKGQEELLAETEKFESEKPDFHEHVQNQRIMRNQTVKYDSRALKYEYAKLAKKYDLKLMILFGSHSKGNIRPDSDVDIAVAPKKELSNDDEQMLHGELVNLLGRDDVDLINLGRTSDVLLNYNVFMDGEVLYQTNAQVFDYYKKQSWFDYQDFGKYFDLMEKATLKRLKKLQSLT